MRRLYVYILMFLSVVCLVEMPLFPSKLVGSEDFEELSIDGIYEISGIQIKFILPKGWRKLKNIPLGLENSIQFTSTDPEIEYLTAINISIDSNLFGKSVNNRLLLESMIEEAKKDVNISNIENITLADSQGYSLIQSIGGMKTKEIMFIKHGSLFKISFMSDESNFNNLLPGFNDSLMTLEIKSPSAGIEKSVAENLSASFTEKILNEFKSISYNVCYESMKEEFKLLDTPVDENTLQNMAKEASFKLIEKYKSVFIFSDSEAKNILSAEYNDTQNKNDIDNCIDKFTKLEGIIPAPVRYLLKRYSNNSLSSLELEFTARLFKEFSRQALNNF